MNKTARKVYLAIEDIYILGIFDSSDGAKKALDDLLPPDSSVTEWEYSHTEESGSVWANRSIILDNNMTFEQYIDVFDLEESTV